MAEARARPRGLWLLLWLPGALGRARGPAANLHSWGTGAEDPGLRSPFERALVITLDAEHFADAKERLDAQGVPSAPFYGFNGHKEPELAESLDLLRRYNNTERLHQTLGNFLACMHMAPGTSPHVAAALAEALRKVTHKTPRTVDELLRHDRHNCVPKMVAIAASHVRLWEDLAAGRLGSGDNWFLVMEDDAQLCPGWRKRMLEELPQAPRDADILKLFFFGHWRAEDRVLGPGGEPTPFLEARDPMRTLDIVRSSSYELLRGATFENVPIAGFYAGTQAYLLRPSGARKLLAAIRGKPFQDIDITMMSSVKHYVWRKVLAMDSHVAEGNGKSLLQVVPICNHEPPKDWFFR